MIAAEIWDALGDVNHYVEPFFGSGAVLLARPPQHRGCTETVNDADGFVANFWRALAADPDAVAREADRPVNENDLHAIHIWLVNRYGAGGLATRLEADPDWYDCTVAGRWVWGLCSWIGSGWCSGRGPWRVLEEENGQRTLSKTGDAGSPLGQGVNRQLPHLGVGQGVNRKLPHLGDAGQGVNRKRPHLGNAGRGDGLLPVDESLYAYLRTLAARLRTVRVCCGDWSRVVTSGALAYGTTVGVFLDPPYSAEANRANDLYAVESLDVAHDVRAWCLANADNPRYRIALCGYEDEHEQELNAAGWRMLRWTARASYQTHNANGSNQANRRKERVWFSPHCLTVKPTLFSFDGEGRGEK